MDIIYLDFVEPNQLTRKPVYLVGITSHESQVDLNDEPNKLFYDLIKSSSVKYNIDLIAEEFSEEALNKRRYKGARDTIARMVSKELNIGYLPCDPDSDERKKLGIKNGKEIAKELGYKQSERFFVLSPEQAHEVDEREKSYWPKREGFWLSKLTGCSFEKCLFILGAKHIDSFSDLLKIKSYQPKTLERDWGVANTRTI